MLSNPIAIFLIVLVIIILGPVLFRPLKIPPIVGMIIAGIIVGPYGFGILDRDDSFRIFGEVGIVYIMFQAAVEIDMFHLRQQYKRGILFGLLSFILPMLAGVFGARYLFDVSWNSAVLIAAMYASHTLVSYPVIGKFGLQNNRGAVIAVCGTIVAVMLALLCLAGVVDVSVNGSYSMSRMIRLLAFTAIYCVIIGTGFPYITRYFFKRNSDSVAQFIFVLAMVFIASLLSQVIGLEAILGAFYAGLILNPYIPLRSPLMKNIRFVGNAIFIPYFLIGVGMLINVRTIVEGWDVVWVVVNMTGIALATKWLAAFLTQKVFRLHTDERQLMFGLSSGKAAATIAAVMIGYQYGLINENIMNGAVVMILICCLVASLITEKAAKNIRLRITAEDLEKDEIGCSEFARQVVSVSNPLTAEGIMRLALFMRNSRNGNVVNVLYVRNDNDKRKMTMGRTALREALSVASDMEVPVHEEERFDINTVSALNNIAIETDATEIMLGFHRRSNFVDSFYGSLIEQLLATTDRMVLMSRCFIPVDTITRIVVVVPPKAEYETGFHLWVTRISTLAANIEARVSFIVYKDTEEFIRAVIADDGTELDFNFEIMDSYDDFILLTGDVREEDLLVVVGARKGSLSWSSDLESVPGFLGKHFSRHNLLVVYPRQF